jgi:hypothetical protein
MDKVILQIQLLLAKRHETTLEDLPFSIRTQQEIIDTQASTTAAFRRPAGVGGSGLAAGRRHWYHEYHAGGCDRAHTRDRGAPGARRYPRRYPLAVPDRSADAQPGRRA